MVKFGVLSRIAAGVVLVVAVVAGASPASAADPGIDWTIRTSAADNPWRSVTYGNGLFVAVANSGTGNRVMTSPDGITWTSQTSAADNEWYGVTYGNDLFVAVGYTTCQVMTSPDGITWTSQTSAAGHAECTDVTYGNALFVAVSQTGAGNRVMTSPDGITWTSQTSATNNDWYSVTSGNGLFVAVGATGTNDRVMTSPDGITWTTRTSAADNLWWGVTYGDGLFVAVAVGATTGTGNRVMTSGVLNTTSGSSGSSVPVFSLSFDSMPGVLVSGTGGSWVSLPTPTNPPAMSPNSTFLGWATYEEFPVAIAQRQIDNGWGAYEVFRDDGSMRGVFIPIAGSACITASGIMYPIWSDSSA